MLGHLFCNTILALQQHLKLLFKNKHDYWNCNVNEQNTLKQILDFQIILKI